MDSGLTKKQHSWSFWVPMTRSFLCVSNKKKEIEQQDNLHQTLTPVWMILLRKTNLHSSAKQQSYTSPCQHTAVQQSETQDWPKSSIEGIIWLMQPVNTAMLAPSHRQISTTVYLHAQFVASFATCDSVPTLTSRRVWHFIIAKLRNGKYRFFCFVFMFVLFVFFCLSLKSLKWLHVETKEEDAFQFLR